MTLVDGTLPDAVPPRRPWDTTAARLRRSAGALQGAFCATEEVEPWLAEGRSAHSFKVERIPFDRLSGWSFAAGTGDLVHSSGRFFTVEGLHVTSDEGPFTVWDQPVINQPEVGILGLLCKEFDGVLHFLMQAKMEPGNRNLVQLSPTVQATRSNYTQAHKGSAVRYIEHFLRGSRGHVLADSLQSEHGSWFLHKSNRNMIVETAADVPLSPGFRWLTLGQINRLLHRANVVNMDARTVLACAPLPQDEAGAVHSGVGLLSWITEERARRKLRSRSVPLRGLAGWTLGPDAISHDEGRFFDVVAVGVQAGSREVARWSQPLFEPRGTGVTAFLTRELGGVRHLLVRARSEPGFPGGMELGPTVQCTPGNYAHLPAADRPAFLDMVQAAMAAEPDAAARTGAGTPARPGPGTPARAATEPGTDAHRGAGTGGAGNGHAEGGRGRVLYSALHSEEGGRFLNAESHYLIVEATEEEAPLHPPEGYAWVTPGQLTALLRHEHYLNVQGRTLLACFHAMTADGAAERIAANGRAAQGG